MKKYAYVVLCCLLLSFSFCSRGNKGKVFEERTDDTKSFKFSGCVEPDTFIKLAERVAPAVVNINTSKTVKIKGFGPFDFFSGPGDDEDDEQGNSPFENFFGFPRQDKTLKQTSLGSGFIINKDGYIITNNHVIEKADEINVTLVDDSVNYKVKVIGKDPKTDIALIKIDAAKDLKSVVFGDSDALKVGEIVVAIGNPFGLSHTVTQGIVSAKGRALGLGNYDSFIQTDASINPGNSGGPLLNIDGDVVGINSAMAQGGQGIGFAIPSNLAKGVITQLKEKGKVTRAWIGVYVQKITDELAKSLNLGDRNGALVSSVFENGPADKAGLKKGDVIVRFGGVNIKDYNELPLVVSTKEVGTKCDVEVLRDGKPMKFSVVLEKLKEDEEAKTALSSDKDQDKIGISVEEINQKNMREFDYEEGMTGVVVRSIRDTSPARDGGLAVGDLIQEINKKKINNLNDYNKMISNLKKGDNVMLYVRRGKIATLFIAFTL